MLHQPLEYAPGAGIPGVGCGQPVADDLVLDEDCEHLLVECLEPLGLLLEGGPEPGHFAQLLEHPALLVEHAGQPLPVAGEPDPQLLVQAARHGLPQLPVYDLELGLDHAPLLFQPQDLLALLLRLVLGPRRPLLVALLGPLQLGLEVLGCQLRLVRLLLQQRGADMQLVTPRLALQGGHSLLEGGCLDCRLLVLPLEPGVLLFQVLAGHALLDCKAVPEQHQFLELLLLDGHLLAQLKDGFLLALQ